MSRLTDIKYRIDQLDGGTFQNLCDAYLLSRGYGTGYSLGMKTGTNKTAKGSPDTYFPTVDGKYAFVMYTTQKDDFMKKAIEDFGKCLDEEKTGLSPEYVSEIIYCHTYGRLSAGEHRQLNDFCKDRNVALTLIGLDDLGNDIYFKYPRIAREFLDISLDTGQIFTINDFVNFNDANKMSAPLNTEFLLRENELKSALEKIALSDVFILSGSAGVGKTRLALQLCKILKEENSWEVICIKSNGLELYEDLLMTLDHKKEYLIFIDDANELSGLQYVLDYLPKAEINTKFIKKIIMTVRSYAYHEVVQKVCEVEVPEVLKIGGFKDQEICKLMESAYGITNDMYLDRIAYIAEGNARLAMLAGKIASETGKIDSIQDATGLYAHYYGRQLQSISDNETTIVSAGIMAFFQTLRLDHLEALKSLFSEVKLTVEQFVLDLRHLHDLELVDLCHDKAAKISDQSFGNYLIKYVFVDKEIIPLGQMIKICFFINKGKTISSCNVLMNVFSDVSTQGYVKQQINRVWDSLVKETTKFLPFFRAFYSIRPTETLLLLKEKIDLEPHRQFDVTSVPFKKDENERSITDDIIEILCGFKLCSQLSEAIELLLCYYQKRPDLFDQIYSAFSYRLGVDKDSYRFGYFTQTTVVDKLINEVEENPSIENILLFIRVAEKMLYLSFSGAESGRGHSVTFYTVPLIMGPEVVEYRRKLWKKLYDIYKKGVCCKEIESLLMDCCRPQREALEKEIVRSDLESIVDFFENFSVDCLYHCVIAEHIEEVAERAEYSNKYILIPFLNSDKYRMYHTLNANRREMLHMEYGEFEEWHRAQVYDMVQEYDIDAFRYLIDVCQECFETVDPKGGQLSFGLSCAIESFSNNKELYIEAVKVYLGANTPYNVKPYTVLSKLFAMMTAEEVKELIMSCDYAQQNVWLWSFFAELPLDQITDTWANDFLKYLENVPHDLHLSSYRPLEDIEKYKCVDEDILIKASRVILSHYEESAFVFSLYFGLMMNPVRAEAKMIIAKYEKDIPLLEDIYLKMIAYSEHEDFEGRFLKSLLELDPKFLYAYLDKMFVEASERYGAYEKWSERLYILWHDEQYLYYMGQISEYIIEKIGEDSWCYRSVMKHLLSQKSHKTAQIERQEEWIQNSINKYYRDQNRMYALFEAISENNETIRRNALKKLLILNDDFGLFENLPLEPSGWGGVGSMIPHMQKRINYLSSILPLLVGITYLKHKQKVERDIEIWKNRIRQEEIEELIDRLG